MRRIRAAGNERAADVRTSAAPHFNLLRPNGKAVPDGAKMAKIHWNAKPSEKAPAPTTVPGTLHDVDFMVKDSKVLRADATMR